MTPNRVAAMLAMLMLWGPGPAVAQHAGGFSVEVLVDGRPLPVYPWRGALYVEATKGREYAVRLRNPLGVRVAVALSVDGLNSIDARRSTAAGARKWVLGPYETVTISGWQTSAEHARRFYFTSEERSYASRLGQADNLGVISAVFFRERQPIVPVTGAEAAGDRAQERARAEGSGRRAPAPPAAAPAEASSQASAEDYAATGIGRRTEHRVRQVSLDLEPNPTASVTLRYEYRPQLVRLGVLPHGPDPLARREGATGFEPGFCPEPPRRIRR